MKDRNLLTSKKRFTAGQCVPTHTAVRTTQFSENCVNYKFSSCVFEIVFSTIYRCVDRIVTQVKCCTLKNIEEERIPFWDLRSRYPNRMNVQRSQSRHRVACTASCATDASVQGSVLDRHRFRASEQESVLSRARAHTDACIRLHRYVAERLLRDERINSKAGGEKEESVLTLPVTVRRGGCSSLVSVNRFALLSRPVYSPLVALPVSPTTKDAARTAATTLSRFYGVRQFGAIDVYHYHEEHCFVPQLNVSGLSKRKSVGPVIAQEIPDENAS
ncbi:hypothetical protein ALC56_03639 [Trachymyrmex septentrionalis]|uniref:Uncharacterized protein n=1 Tax=Trachymyrmex septentrionalis TaxID=34720 RepID=A0A151K062_9HYME|nr:hypothetical protein ALC56_03639 [Trachymyrmex septentrionalis]